MARAVKEGVFIVSSAMEVNGIRGAFVFSDPHEVVSLLSGERLGHVEDLDTVSPASEAVFRNIRVPDLAPEMLAQAPESLHQNLVHSSLAAFHESAFNHTANSTPDEEWEGY
jgi:hypothetical protein